MKRVLIIEPEAAGHRLNHVRLVARELVTRGVSTSLLTQSATLGHPAYRELREDLGDTVETVTFPVHRLADRILASPRFRPNTIVKQVAYDTICRRFFRQVPAAQRPDLIVVPYLESLEKTIALRGAPFGKTPWMGLVMKCTFHHREMGINKPAQTLDPVKRAMYHRVFRARGLKALFTIDELLCEYLDREQNDLHGKVSYVADPVEMRGSGSRQSCRERLGIDPDATVILVYGEISLRKGVEELLIAAGEPEFPSRSVILLAGSQIADVKDLLGGPIARCLRSQGRLIERDGYHFDQDEYAVFRAADIVWIGYRNFYMMSGVMIQAGAMELPVVATDRGLVGWKTRRYGLGHAVAVDRPREVARSIAELAHDRSLAQSFGANGLRLAQAHTGQEFARRVCDKIETALWAMKEGVHV